MIDVKTLTVISSLLLLAGCSRHPYAPPKHAMAEQFSEQKSAAASEPLTEWWHQFNDPILNRLIARALAHNYDLLSALERIEEARAFYNIKKAELFPQVDVTGNVIKTGYSDKALQYSALEGQSLASYQFGFDAFWELDIWGKIWHEKNARACLFQAEIDRMRDIYIMLLADVSRAYIDLCAYYKKMHLWQQMYLTDKELLCLQRALFAAGLSSQIEVTQQEQSTDTSANQLKYAQTIMTQAKHQLAILLGLNPENLILKKIRTSVPLSTHQLAIGMPSELLQRRPDIRQAERMIAASHEKIEQARAEYYPSFSLLGSLHTDSSTGSDWFKMGSATWSIGPSIRWPLINFGRLRANLNVQKSRNRQAILNYQQTILNALKEVENNLIAYFNSQQQLAITTAKNKSALHEELLIDATYASGINNNIQALQKKKNRIFTTLELTDIEQQLSTTLIALYKALGGGW